jgi:hypothetical protein
MGENASVTSCASCQDLQTEFIIRFPSDLRKAIAVTRDNLADGTIEDITPGGDCRPFDELVTSGKWDDVLQYRFQCNTCGQLFELHADTYHGSGGWWRPIE